MTSKMFISPPGGMSLRAIDAPAYLALRAAAPAGVFDNAEAKVAFLAGIGGDKELAAIADYTFQINDYLFAKQVPSTLHALLVTLMSLAYRAKVRPIDQRVRDLM